MKIHVEFNSIAEMVHFGKFVGNEAVQVPPSKKEEAQALAYKSAYERTEANLLRAYERLKELNNNPKIKKVIDEVAIEKHAKEWDEREKTKQEALENDDRFCFTVRTLNVLKAENVHTLKELLKHSESDLMKFPNLGKLSLKSIKEELAKHKLKLAGVGK